MLNTARVTVTSCPSQQGWFDRMMRGAESRMGYTTQRQQPLGTSVIVKLLELIKEDAEEQDRDIASELFKVGAAIATAVCASLRGPEVFMMELSALRKHIQLGRGGIVPKNRPHLTSSSSLHCLENSKGNWGTNATSCLQRVPLHLALS